MRINIEVLEAGAETRETLLGDAQTGATAAHESLTGIEAELDAARGNLARLAARRQTFERARDEAAKRVSRLSQALDTNAAEQAKAEADAAAAPDVARAAEALERQRGETDAARSAVLASEAARIAAQAAIDHSREPLAAADKEVARLRAEERAIATLLGSGGGLWPKLIDAIDVQPGYEAALAAALGDDLDVPLDEAAPAHWRALPPVETFAGLPDGVMALSLFVRAPEALARRLAQIGVVEAGVGDALQAGLATGQRLVSMAGALWRWDGLRSAADAETPAAIRLAQRNRLGVVKDELTGADQAAADARTIFHAAREASEVAAGAERDARQILRAHEQALSVAERAAADAEREAIRHSARAAALRETAERLAIDYADADKAAVDAAAGLAEVTGETELAQRIQELQSEVGTARTKAAEARGAVEAAKREMSIAAARGVAAGRELEDWTRRGDAARSHIAALEERQGAGQSDLAEIEKIPGEIEVKRRALLEAIGTAETARREAAEALAAGEAEAARADREAKAADAALSDAREARAHRIAGLENARSRLAETAARIREALECEPDGLLEKAGHDEGDAFPALDQIDAKVDRLKRERESLGGVNLRADEEATEYETRLESMTAEKADLESAIAKLRGAIGSLNREGRERLLAAFDTVNGHFKRLFTTLFGGGEAELTLTESDDPLEAGLEILAKPPGKKQVTLSLLSGGEQTLTALSLIFAIFLSNPSPICVLDEVDAPLDDANIERFCNLMDEMTKLTETRFLMITHHAFTMARMDRLLGVTMQERGVSQLVSVDLVGAERLAAE